MSQPVIQLGTVVAITLLVIPSAAQVPVTDEKIREAWLARQKRCDAVRVEWTKETTIPKGHLDDMAKAEGKGNDAHFPPKEIVTRGHQVLLVAGGKYRMEKSGETWSIGAGISKGYESKYYRSVNQHVSIFKKDHANEYDTAHLHRIDYQGVELRPVAYFPVVSTVRGAYADEPFGDLIADYELTNRTMSIRGAICVEATNRKRTEKLTDSLWLDPKRDFLVAKRVILSGGATVAHLDVELAPHPVIGWVPKSWTSVTFKPDKSISEAVKCTITEWAVDVPVADKDFVPVLLPGTRVVDHTGGTQEEYVVRTDGSEGGRVQSRQLPSYEQLVATRPRSRLIGFSVGAAVIALLTACVWMWVRFRRSRACVVS